MTIAFSVEADEELDRLELHHFCPEKALAGLLAHEQSPATSFHPN
jgi:hypothetical protein